MKTATLIIALLLGVHAAQAAEVSMSEKETPNAETAAPSTPSGVTTVAVLQMKPQAPIRLEPLADPIERYRSGVADDSGDVRNAEPGYQYTYILPGDYSEVALQGHRQSLVDEGFQPRTGPYAGPKPGNEYVAGKGDVEIWRRPESVANAEHLDRLTTCVLSPDWFRQYRRHERGQLPDEVRFAALVYHGIEQPPAGKSKPTADQMRALIFRHVKPHPGAPKKKLADWG